MRHSARPAIWQRETAFLDGHYLRDQGVKPDTLVGLCVNRSTDMLVAILAILKAGGAYLPLDPGYPQNRLDHMVSDSGMGLLISQKGLPITANTNTNTNTDTSPNINTVWLDDPQLQQAIKNQSDDNPVLAATQTPAHLAYVIYTSGSTGLPKGVMLEHSGAVNLALYQQNRFAVTAQSRVLQFASLSFDAATSEWLMALLKGATLVICHQSHKQSIEQLQAYLLAQAVTHATLPPALLEHLDVSLDYALQSLIVAGESCDAALAQRWLTQCQLFNAYGPTETTVCASVGQLTENSGIHIGRAMANTQLYVLGHQQQLLPKGSIGELYIGGAGLARGYLNRAQLSEQSFIQHPFAGDRLYKTGDLVRYRADNSLEFIDRRDSQVKIRGFRIELGEVQHQLSQLPEVQAAVVLAHNAQLVAYYTSESTLADSALVNILQSGLKTTLADPMVPSLFIRLDQLPLTTNGKVDQQALPAPNEQRLSTQYIAPSGDTQNRLAEIWADLLKIELDKLSADANFFELGGHSILLMRLLAQVKEIFAINLVLAKLFELSRLDELADYIDQQRHEPQGQPVEQIKSLDAFDDEDEDMEEFEL